MEPANKKRPPVEAFRQLVAQGKTRLEIAKVYRVAGSTVTKWSQELNVTIPPAGHGGVRKGPGYRYSRRLQKDITEMRDLETRPKCANCGKPMAKAGATRQGLQKWRCGKNFQICSTLVWGTALAINPETGRRKSSKLPQKEVLAGHLKEGWTFTQIAAHYGLSRQTVANRVWELGLTGISPHRHPTRQHNRGEPPKPVAGSEANWLRKRLGRPFGGSGWHNWAGIERARAEVMQ